MDKGNNSDTRKGKKPSKRSRNTNALEYTKDKKPDKKDKKSHQCKSFIGSDMDCPPILGSFRGCGTF